MKKSLTQALGFCAALLLTLTACKKDEVRAVLTPGAAPTLTSSASSFVLAQANSGNRAVIYSWTPVQFGYQAVVDYNLQFDVKGGDFSKPYVVDAGSKLADTLSVSDLNTAFQSKGLVNTTGAPTPTQMDVRVVATVSSDASVPRVASAATTFTATPYAFCQQPAKSWSLIGDAISGWSTDVVMTYDCVSKTYSYKGPIKAMAGTSPAGYKFRFNSDWTANLGGASPTGGALTQDGPNLSVAADGTYTIVLTPASFDAAGKSTGGTFTIK